MSMIAIPLSQDISRLFNSVDVPGKRDASDHITMFYLGDDYPMNKICKLIPVIHEITSNIKPFEVQASKITTFPSGKYGYPVIAPLKSATLQKLRSDIKSAFAENKIKFEDTYPDYNPHVTLSYSDEKPEKISFAPVSWSVNSIALFGGNNGMERLFISFPFQLAIKKSASYINEFAKMYENSIK